MRWITIKYKIIHLLPGFTNYRFNDSTLIMIHRKYIQHMYDSMIFQNEGGLLQNTGEGATRLFSNWLGKRGDFFVLPWIGVFDLLINGLDRDGNKIQITINIKFRIVSTSPLIWPFQYPLRSQAARPKVNNLILNTSKVQISNHRKINTLLYHKNTAYFNCNLGF